MLYTNLMGVPSQIYGDLRAAQSGLPVVNALVRLQQTGVSTYTDNFGHYRLVTVPGVFTVELRHPCYDVQFIADVECLQDDSTRLDANLTRPVIHLAFSSLNLIVPNRLESTQDVPVENSGDGILRVRASVLGNFADETWLRVSPEELDIPPQSNGTFTVIISPDTSNNQNWDYQGAITLHTNSCPDTVVRIPVNAYVLDAPDRSQPAPDAFTIRNIYPNPFNNATRITYTLPQAQEISLAVYDLQGRAAQLVAQGWQTAGEHSISLSGDNLAAGIYFLSLTGREQHTTQKIVLLK